MLCISIKDNLHLIIGYGKKPNMYILGNIYSRTWQKSIFYVPQKVKFWWFLFPLQCLFV